MDFGISFDSNNDGKSIDCYEYTCAEQLNDWTGEWKIMKSWGKYNDKNNVNFTKKINYYKKVIIKCICLLFILLSLSACSDKKCSNSPKKNISSCSSSIEKKFSLKQDTPKQKENIKQIINLYNQRGLLVEVYTFNDGYEVKLKNESLLEDVRNNDQNGFIRNKIIPITKYVSEQTHTKLYFNANDPNLELIVISDNGKIEYTINLSN